MGIDYGRAKTYTVGNWLEVWYENYAKIKMRPSTYLTYHEMCIRDRCVAYFCISVILPQFFLVQPLCFR